MFWEPEIPTARSARPRTLLQYKADPILWQIPGFGQDAPAIRLRGELPPVAFASGRFASLHHLTLLNPDGHPHPDYSAMAYWDQPVVAFQKVTGIPDPMNQVIGLGLAILFLCCRHPLATA